MNLHKYLKIIQGILPHVLFVLSGLFMMFMILDQYNPTKQFAVKGISVGILWILCTCTMIQSVLILIDKHHGRS